MSGWEVGDRAVCVRATSPWCTTPLVEGVVYTIAALVIAGSSALDAGELGFRLVEVPVPGDFKGFHHSRFRKIRPDKHEACEDEFITLLKRRKVDA